MRERTPKRSSNTHRRSPARRGRCAPRPLAVQRLADELVGNEYGRDPLCQGLSRGHVGAVCEAIIAAGIDPLVWSGRQVKSALEADMRASASYWPDRIERPGAFLASRLRRLPTRPDGAHAGDARAAGTEERAVARRVPQAEPAAETGHSAQQRAQQWYDQVSAVTSADERRTVLRAHEVKFGPTGDPFAALAGAGRRAARLFPHLPLVQGLRRWADEVLAGTAAAAAARPVPATSLSTDLLVNLAIGACECGVCGSPNSPVRLQLPLQNTVCDQCWPVIARDLDQAGDTDEGIPT